MEVIGLEDRDRRNLYKEDPDNVLAVAVTVAEVRDELDMDDLYSHLDDVQARVFGGDHDVAYLVIRVHK